MANKFYQECNHCGQEIAIDYIVGKEYHLTTCPNCRKVVVICEACCNNNGGNLCDYCKLGSNFKLKEQNNQEV